MIDWLMDASYISTDAKYKRKRASAGASLWMARQVGWSVRITYQQLRSELSRFPTVRLWFLRNDSSARQLHNDPNQEETRRRCRLIRAEKLCVKWSLLYKKKALTHALWHESSWGMKSGLQCTQKVKNATYRNLCIIESVPCAKSLSWSLGNVDEGKLLKARKLIWR